MNIQKIILMRGIPGSGKSVLAKSIKDTCDGHYKVEIFSTDDFWMRDGRYMWDRALLDSAHKWNQSRVDNALYNGVDIVIVDNTNLTSFDVGPYFSLALKHSVEIKVINVDTPVDECIARQANRPEDRAIDPEVIEKMAEKFAANMINVSAELAKAKLRDSIIRL